MPFFYPFPYTGEINRDALTEQVNAVHPAVDGFNTETAGIITVIATAELDQTTQNALAAVIAAHDPNVLTDAQTLAAAVAALEEGFVYLRQQLDDDTPASLATMTTNIKNRVDTNTYLTRWMTRYLNLWSGATTLPVSMNPNTDPLRNRYVLVFSHLVSIRRQIV